MNPMTIAKDVIILAAAAQATVGLVTLGKDIVVHAASKIKK